MRGSPVVTDVEVSSQRQELLASHGIRLHGLLAGSPVGGADLIGMGLHVLECLENAERLVNVTANGEVVDRGVHDHVGDGSNGARRTCSDHLPGDANRSMVG